ncbi:MAG: 3-dehydroquinate synthase [Hamadaea sp.]|uniref:3-dehydroquinate synthase n=1 Tax=Hamadaea sp. TaxID=2024425 RepID=UPI0017E3B9B7|nr:3-dehydroquinate synthase [Hamadaea sp.]NUR73584.1 3-dehydroquinate synthase [Hamadaea sp.]NUT18245.1 3-dehydroquinate synthase [Hamadaea sp.]
METTAIPVGGPKPYDVFVGRGLHDELPRLTGKATRAAVIFTRSVEHYAQHAAHSLIDAGLSVLPVEIPDAESGKSLATAQLCWDALGAAGFTRSDVIVGVGGGAATDLAGYVAACWLRGVAWIPMSTSINGMVDAAIGGKTGINVAAGKNLVGAFHPPAGVLCELSALDTLPADQLRAGLAEVVKGGFIADPVILDLFEAGLSAAIDPAGPVLRELIERKVRVKAEVVAEDLTEQGRREILNYGHTLGHAIERVEGYTWPHGHAVAVGMVYAALLSRRTGRVDVVDWTRRILTELELPVTYRADAWEQLLPAMRVDKKARGAALRFVLLDEVAKPVTVPIEDEALLRAAYEELVR